MPVSSKEQILMILAKEWEIAGPPRIIDISDIAAIVPLAPSETMAAQKELFTSGLVDMNELKTTVFLTPEGYAYIENKKYKDKAGTSKSA
ncbi:MAG: hypothetical protein JRI88_02435 [Deltaproteobacteria bacterium]|nr:hypothetical protein [Deltaproteobacteria bacterium]